MRTLLNRGRGWISIILVATGLLAVSIPIAKSQAPSTDPIPELMPPAEPPMAPPTAGADAVQPTTGTQPDANTATFEQPQAGGDEVIRVISEIPRDRVETSSTDENLINVTVEKETLENVVNMFTRISGANIVTTTDDLQGQVTVNLRDVQWRPALGAILDVHNLALVEKMPGSGVYSIVAKPPRDSEPLVVETVFLNFTTVPELQPLLATILAPVSNAMISTLPTRNAMVIRTTEPNMQEMLKLIEQMDVPGKQVIVETKFMELTDSASKQLGIRWDSLDSFGVRVDGSPNLMEYKREVLRDDARAQLQSKSDTSSSQNSTFANAGSTFADGVTSEEAGAQGSSSGSASSSQSTSGSSSGDGYSRLNTEIQSAVLNIDTFSVVLSALKKTDGVSIVSNPKLIVASGSTDAFFTVGEREPIIKTEIQRGTAESPGDIITAELDTAVNTDFIKEGYLETGIELRVIPTVKTDDLIEAKIMPRLIRNKFDDKEVGNNSWPRISVKEISTSFTLQSGQTVAIGGLTDTKDDKKVSKVPLLGDIPLVGKYLFSHSSDIKSQMETIIFVTLSLAEPTMLYQEAGIPQQSELVHKALIRSEDHRRGFESQLATLKQASSDKAAAEQKLAQQQQELQQLKDKGE